jgi:hypothetical protein
MVLLNKNTLFGINIGNPSLLRETGFFMYVTIPFYIVSPSERPLPAS